MIQQRVRWTAWAPWVEGGAFACLVFLLYGWGGEGLRTSYHAWLHTSIGEGVLRDGLLPENPYHAGVGLRYYTLFPMLGVTLGKLGFGPLWGFALLNILGALLLGPALDRLGRSFSLSFTARRYAFGLAILGFNGLGWLGGVFLETPVSPVSPLFETAPFTWAGTSVHWDLRLQSFIPKFLAASSFALSLAPALWSLAFVKEGMGKHCVLPLAVTLAINPLTGVFVGCLILWLLVPRWMGRPASVLPWAGIGCAALFASAPFLLPGLSGAPQGGPKVEVQLGGQPFWNWLGPLVGLLPWGMLGLKRMDPSTRWGLLGFLGLAGLCVLLIRLPWGNEYKFARLGALLWVIPAARGLEHFSEHRKHVPWLCLGAFLPTTVLCAHAAVTWAESAKSTPPLVLTKGSVEWDPSLGYQPTVDWLRHSETSAVLLVDPGEWGAPGSLQGNPWAAVVPQALAVDFLHVHNEGQPDLEARLADAFAVYRSKDSVKVLAGLESMRAEFAGRVLLVLDAQGRPELSSVFEQEGGQRVVGSDGNAPQLWKFQPPASGN